MTTLDSTLEAMNEGFPVAPVGERVVLTPAQVTAIMRTVVKAGGERIEVFGPSRGTGPERFSEADFLAGAMAVIHAITGSMSQVPPLWILGGPMVGRSIVDPKGDATRRYTQQHPPARRVRR